MLEELHAALTTSEASAAIASARATVAQPSSYQGVMKAVMPVMQGFGQEVMRRFNFSGGIPEALNAATTVGRKEYDKRIRRLVEAIGEVITGERKAGRVPELTATAEGFVDMSDHERSAAIVHTERVLGNLTAQGMAWQGVGAYLEAMRGIVERGSAYLEEAIVELAVQVARGSAKASPSAAESQKMLSRRLNVFMEFLREGDHQRIQERIRVALKSARKGSIPNMREEL